MRLGVSKASGFVAVQFEVILASSDAQENQYRRYKLWYKQCRYYKYWLRRDMQLRHYKCSRLNQLAESLESMQSSRNQLRGHPFMLVSM